jgi:hypothetical protein
MGKKSRRQKEYFFWADIGDPDDLQAILFEDWEVEVEKVKPIPFGERYYFKRKFTKEQYDEWKADFGDYIDDEVITFYGEEEEEVRWQNRKTTKRKVDKSKVKKKYIFSTRLDERNREPYYMIDMERLFDVEVLWRTSTGIRELSLLGTRKSIREFIDMYKEQLEDGSSLYYTTITKGERKYYWGKEFKLF